MTSQNIINFEHVEVIKKTSDTTVYVRFTSGAGEVFEFQNAEKVDDMMRAFIDWCNGGSHRKVYTILKELK